MLATYVVSDKTTPTTAQLRIRVMGLDGSVLKDVTQPIVIPPLSSQSYANWALTPFMNSQGTDSAKIFAVTDLVVGGETVSRT